MLGSLKSSALLGAKSLSAWKACVISFRPPSRLWQAFLFLAIPSYRLSFVFIAIRKMKLILSSSKQINKQVLVFPLLANLPGPVRWECLVFSFMNRRAHPMIYSSSDAVDLWKPILYRKPNIWSLSICILNSQHKDTDVYVWYGLCFMDMVHTPNGDNIVSLSSSMDKD